MAPTIGLTKLRTSAFVLSNDRVVDFSLSVSRLSRSALYSLRQGDLLLVDGVSKLFLANGIDALLLET